MKIILISLSVLFLTFSFFQCAGSQKPDPAVITCRENCRTTSDRCVKKGFNNKAKIAACEAVKVKCIDDCEK